MCRFGMPVEMENLRMKIRSLSVFAACVMLVTVLGGCSIMKQTGGTDNMNQTDGSYDCTDCCMKYLNYIGENLKNRDITPDGQTPSEDNRHQQTIDWIVGELKSAGYSDSQIELQNFDCTDDYSGESYSGTNIVLSIEGSKGDTQIIAGSHYDGDGCGDNGSGIALLLGNAVSMADMGRCRVPCICMRNVLKLCLYCRGAAAIISRKSSIQHRLVMYCSLTAVCCMMRQLWRTGTS